MQAPRIQFTASFRALPGRNLGTRAFLILMASPVRGLRPVRAARSDTANVPKPTRVTEPFFLRVVLTAPTKASRARPTSALDRSVLEEMCSISSVLFMLRITPENYCDRTGGPDQLVIDDVCLSASRI